MSTLVQLGRKALDSAGRRLCCLDGEVLCAEVRRRTGLHDFGDPPIQPALSILVDSLEREAGLHPLGRCLIRFHLRDLLENRLRLANLWQKQREQMESIPIERPVFIVGMPRSGSTFLHELLAQDPQNRAPRVWEVIFPVPRQENNARDRARRIRRAQVCLWWFRRLAPQADAVYPMRALTPHECVAIHSYTFQSEEFISTCRVPTYEGFLRSTNPHPVYAWQKRFLQYLQLRTPAQRWVLKAPDHVRGLRELFAVFPDAVIVQTHRDPVAVLKSATELTRVLHGLYAWADAPGNIAAREARILAENSERFIRFRDDHPHLAGRFIDVKYSDLVANPVGVIGHIYGRLGVVLTAEAADRIEELAARRSRYRGSRMTQDGGAPAYPGIDLERSMQRYCLRFKVTGDCPVTPSVRSPAQWPADRVSGRGRAVS